MDKTLLNKCLSAVMETLDETAGGTAPAGILYAALGANGVTWRQWECVRAVMRVGGCVTSEGGMMTVTARGREIAQKSRVFRAAYARQGVRT